MQRGKRVLGYPSDLFQGGATGPTLDGLCFASPIGGRGRPLDALDVPSDLFLLGW